MTKQEIAEKVIVAVSHCLRANDISHCEGCPYNTCKDFACRAELRDDIKKLLKKQDVYEVKYVGKFERPEINPNCNGLGHANCEICDTYCPYR